MRIDLLLLKKGLVQSRQEAHEALKGGHIIVNGAIVTKRSKDINEQAEIENTFKRKYVSRGGEKIEGAFLDYFGEKATDNSFLKGKNALDIGSSTGGFTDYLLQHDVERVTCVDVGTNQLHVTLRQDARVTFFEETDIRTFSSSEMFDCIVVDLSFISLAPLFSCFLSLAHKGTLLVFLCKPQFEVGKGNTKKGIVKNNILVTDLLAEYEELLSKEMRDLKVIPSRLLGGDGNQEYFIMGYKDSSA